MEGVEFNPGNPAEYYDFVSGNERKNQKIMLFIAGGIIVAVIGIGIYTIYQQNSKTKWIKEDI